MNKIIIKNQNAITLIALIITIIILVILAAVSIRAIYNMGIVGHAINGTQDYARGAVQEKNIFDRITELLDTTLVKIKGIQDGCGITLNKERLGLQLQANTTVTEQLTATVVNLIGDVTWESSAPNVATVSEEGLVTAVSLGNTVVTASIVFDGKEYSASCEVNITDVPVTSVNVSPTSVVLNKGGTTTLTAEVGPANVTDNTVTWSSGDSTIATVDANGVVTAIAGGTTQITATANDGSGYSANCTVTVNVPVTGLALYKSGENASTAANAITASVDKDATITLLPVFTPSDSSNKMIIWTTSNSSVATVSSGVVTGVAAGTATITATANGGTNVTASCVVTVRMQPVGVIVGAEFDALTANGMTELTEDQITNVNLKNNENIRAVLTGQVPIPTGYTYVEGTSTASGVTKPEGGSWGVVIEDEDENQWVWVPVNATESIDPSDAFETIQETSIAQANIENRRLASVFDGVQLASIDGLKGIMLASTEDEEIVTKTVTKMSKTIIEGYDRSTPDDTSSYREPALVTDYDLQPQYYTQAGNFATAQEFADAMVTDYYDMVASIEKYGGFYVGRYELSGTNNGSDQEITSPKVQSGQAPMDSANWYRLYQAERKFNTSSTTSTMIWGIQWDIVCLWAQSKGDQTSYSTFQSNRPSGDYYATTGSNSNDKRNNIYDLEGSRYEWTQEAYYTDDRANRGGDYDDYNGDASYRNDYSPDDYYSSYGSRPTLYIR